MTGGQRRVLLGRIAGAHGIRGEVLIKPYTSAPEGIAAYGPLEDAKSGRQFEIAVVGTAPKGIVARIAGIADRSSAEALKGVELSVSRDRLPAPTEGEFYHADLIGLRIVDRTGREIGEIVGIENFGAGDLLEFRRTGSRATALIPFTETFVPEVDLERRRVVVDIADETPDDA